MTNKERVQAIYAAFGRGDIPAILAQLSPAVDWDYAYPGIEVPWLQPRRGREGAGQFFAALAALEFHRFEITALAEAPGLVVALADLACTVKATGKPLREDGEAHLWFFDDSGQVTRFRHCADTAQHLAALRR
jgi:uncharacterized protein